MSTPIRPYLNALTGEMANTILPATAEGMPRQIAMCSTRILAGLQCEADTLPGLQAAAMVQYRDLLPQLTVVLGDADDLAALTTALADEGNYSQTELAIQEICALLIRHDAAEAATLLGQLTAVEVQLRSGMENRLQQLLESKATEDQMQPAFDEGQTARLTDYLKTIFPEETELTISGVKAIPGGFSKQTIFVSFDNSQTLPSTLVIRLDKADSPVGTTVRDEYELIKTLFEHDVAVPQPFALEDSGEVLGGAFLVVSKIEGGNAGDAMDVQTGSPELVHGIAQAAARMHRVPEGAFGADIEGTGMSTQERMLADIEDFEGRWRGVGTPSIALETAFGWLKKNVHLAEGHRSLVHKDVGCHNFLCKDGVVTAFVDWETAAMGNPAQDLGYLRKTIVQMGNWDTFLDAYGEAGAPVPSPEEIDYYELWGFTWLNTMIKTASMAFLAGMTDDIQLGYSGLYHHMRLDAQLNDALARICF